jgi:ABC-type transport system involved in cytochrome bd biosynthesis fused ATPase/permease subunit
MAKKPLARLFYRDADLVVMDEPTSALDAFLRVNLFTSVFGVRKNDYFSFSPFVSIEKADVIYVMKKRPNCREGDFDTLISQKSYFVTLMSSIVTLLGTDCKTQLYNLHATCKLFLKLLPTLTIY